MNPGLLVFVFLLLATPARAFQLADTGAPVSVPPVKYIFYWAEYQCELTEANGYQGALTFSPAGFRQTLLRSPTIWNGTTLLRDFSFSLDGVAISTENYVARLGELDALFGPKAQPGSQFRISGLPLADGVSGTVNLLIEAPEIKAEAVPARGGGGPYNAPFLNERLLERVVWGREDIMNVSDRDFFTVAEFWQTVRLQPYLEWLPGLTEQPVRAEVQFQNFQQGSFGQSALLSDDREYRQMLDNLNNYRHLAKAGARVILNLQTAEQYEPLFTRPMRLVADDDQRLRLRRSRDAHTIEIEWGSFRTSLNGLYLSSITDGQGNSIPADESVSLGLGFTFGNSMRAENLTASPVCRVDGEAIAGFTFRLNVAGQTCGLGDGRPLSETEAERIVAGMRGNEPFELDSFYIPGYTTPPIHFTVRFIPVKDVLPVRNDLETLLKATSGFAPVQLSTPVVTTEEIQVSFALPAEVSVKLTFFDVSGLAVYQADGTYRQGRHTLNIPRESIRSRGKHYVFLNTPFGVVKEEIEL